MNSTYPYPIDNARYIPSSENVAQERYSELLDCTDLQAVDTPAFLRGWFAIYFLGIAPHPDEPDEWDDIIRPLVDEAWRRHENRVITDGQLYCSGAAHQGLRLALDGNLRCHVHGRVGEQAGYVSAEFDSKRGNIPMLTGISAKAYIYESPQKAEHACRHLDLDTIEIYAGSPDRDMDCPPVIEIPMKKLPDMEVVIMTQDGLYLYRDGKTLGDSHVLACKYMLHADNVEQQLQQVKTQLGVTWTWVDYATLH